MLNKNTMRNSYGQVRLNRVAYNSKYVIDIVNNQLGLFVSGRVKGVYTLLTTRTLNKPIYKVLTSLEREPIRGFKLEECLVVFDGLAK